MQAFVQSKWEIEGHTMLPDLWLRVRTNHSKSVELTLCCSSNRVNDSSCPIVINQGRLKLPKVR